MTRDDIIRMAREAGIDAESDTLCRYSGWVEPLERFAALVAAAARNRTWTQDHWTEYERAIVAAERERCVKECDAVVDQLRALHRATMGYEDACVLRGAELVADALREGLEGKK